MAFVNGGRINWVAPGVVRVDEPFNDDERSTLEGFLEWGRYTLLDKCAGLSGEQLALRAVPPSNLSLLGLIRHLTDVERSWFRRRLSGESVPPLYSRPEMPDAAMAPRPAPPASANSRYAASRRGALLTRLTALADRST